MTEKILVVEDEVALRETLAYNLEKQGFVVITADNGLTAVESAKTHLPDLILLDLMLPGLDGFEVCRAIRQDLNTPIIMLTAKDDVIDRVVGLEVGADDYITKPFSMREVMARVKAMLRRARIIREGAAAETGDTQVEADKVLVFDNLKINLSRHEAYIDDKVIELKPKEYDLLVYLCQHRGQLLSRQRILTDVWGWEYYGNSRTVDVHVRWLRERLEEDPQNPKRIVTIRSAGYRFDG